MTRQERKKMQSLITLLKSHRWTQEKGFVLRGQSVIMECPEDDVKPLVDDHMVTVNEALRIVEDMLKYY